MEWRKAQIDSSMKDNLKRFSRCDRRLSRAAREILQNHLQSVVKEQKRSKSSSTFELAEDWESWSVWDLLDHLLSSRNTSCPLSVSDSLRTHEEHSYVIAAGRISLASATPYAVSTPRGQKYRGQKKLNPHWYQCGFCDKIFSTRYYLDRHMEEHHTDRLLTSGQCPATSWCQFLSTTTCHDMAMELEPYYDRGSQGYGDDGKTVRRRLEAQTPPCSDRELLEAYNHCRDVLDLCFDNDVTRILRETMCVAHTCHERLHHLILPWLSSASALKHMTSRAPDWRDEWDAHHLMSTEHIIAAVLIIVIVMAPVCFQVVEAWHRRQRPRSRLLGKPSRRSWKGRKVPKRSKQD